MSRAGWAARSAPASLPSTTSRGRRDGSRTRRRRGRRDRAQQASFPELPPALAPKHAAAPLVEPAIEARLQLVEVFPGIGHFVRGREPGAEHAVVVLEVAALVEVEVCRDE